MTLPSHLSLLQRLSTGEDRLLQLNDITDDVKERMAAFKSGRGNSEGESEFHSTFAQVKIPEPLKPEP